MSRFPRLIALTCTLVMVSLLGATVFAVRGAATTLAESSLTVGDEDTLNTDVDVDIDGFLNWALLDRDTDVIAGDHLTKTSTPQSMIKPWLVADYLNRSGSHEPAMLDDASLAIRDSDDEAAQRIYQANGADASIERLISTCELTDTSVFAGRWSKTEMSAQDSARMGRCIADGTAAGDWTEWLLDEMRSVRGDITEQYETSGGGRWGIIDGLDDATRAQIAIKNGWTRMADGDWDLNCMAVHDDWVLTVMMGYPGDYSAEYGAERCAKVASQIFGTG